MVRFRRSLKSEKHDSAKPQHNIQHFPVPPKDAFSILPPKKVIKALYDYDAPSEPPIYLSFTTGDFLHVISRENDDEWYEACNPVLGTRGLVPAQYFETVGKTAQDIDSRGSTGSTPSTHHDSGYAGTSDQLLPEQHRMSKSMGKIGGGPVYGVVAYDFKAERPDELDAKEGEAIIVIAQSNSEWYVAKPITRLGGPGLIPVSFIEIKDMSTGKTVSDSQAAVARAGIPKVEEWKKMAADYKNTSIPLGSFGSQNTIPAGSMAGLESGMGRMSMNGRPASSQANGYARHSRTPSQFAPPPPPQLQHSAAPVRAAVPRYLYAEDKFHFVVEVALSDNTHWDLTRIYEEFYELQINLIKAFPEEAGNTGLPRTLPLMPGPVQFVTDRITEGRRENLDEYLYRLIHLGAHISNSDLVKGFFQPRGNDYECEASQVDFNEHSRSQYAPGGDRHRDSTMSHGSAPGYAPSVADFRQSSQPQQPVAGHQRGQSSVSGSLRGQSHYRTPSEYTNAPASASSGSMPPPMLRQGTASSAMTTASSASAGAPLKVKVWFDRETCVVLRLPPRGSFNFTDLYRKIVERRRLEYNKHVDGDDLEDALEVEYRDEKTGEYYRLNDDQTLDTAVGRNEKLTLVVRTAGTSD